MEKFTENVDRMLSLKTQKPDGLNGGGCQLISKANQIKDHNLSFNYRDNSFSTTLATS